jgi:plasmid stabilization system protein ParE
LEKKVIWTSLAKQDLRDIYEFKTETSEEEKAFALVKKLIMKADILYKVHTGGTRYISNLHPEINYKKLIEGNYIIIYREEGKRVWINRVFCTKQDPDKLNL